MRGAPGCPDPINSFVARIGARVQGSAWLWGDVLAAAPTSLNTLVKVIASSTSCASPKHRLSSTGAESPIGEA